MGEKQIEKVLKIFTRRIKEKFDPEEILLFGSYAGGKAGDYSDVDLVVIAEKFSSIPEEKRLDVLYDITSDLYPDFHVFGYTRDEFEKASKLTILEEVKQNGISLLP